MNEGLKQNYELAEADYIAGMKYKDIAQKYGVSLNTVKSWKVRYGWEKNKSKSVHTKSKKVCTQNKNKKGIQKAVADEVSQVIENTDLTDKQGLFCCLYIKCFNAAKAYQKVYECDYVTATVNGSRLLGNAKVKEEILRLKRERLNREFLSEEDIFQKYMDIAFADITDYVEFGSREIQYTDKAGVERTIQVAFVDLKDSSGVDGTLITEIKQGKDGASIKLADRMKALQWISDHMDLATEEQRTRIEVLKSQVVQKDEAKEQVRDWKAAIIEVAKRRSGK